MPEETITIRQNNAFAMQSGLILGLWSIVAVGAMLYGVRYVWPGSLGEIMGISSPFVAAMLTIRFRQTVCAPGQAFTFGTAYLHVLLMGIYAGLWLALAVYVYFAYLDGGQFYTACLELFNRPEMADAVREIERSPNFTQLSGDAGVNSLADMLGAFQSLPPAAHAGSIISLTFFTAPIISLVIALFTCRRTMHIH